MWPLRLFVHALLGVKPEGRKWCVHKRQEISDDSIFKDLLCFSSTLPSFSKSFTITHSVHCTSVNRGFSMTRHSIVRSDKSSLPKKGMFIFAGQPVVLKEGPLTFKRYKILSSWRRCERTWWPRYSAQPKRARRIWTGWKSLYLPFRHHRSVCPDRERRQDKN